MRQRPATTSADISSGFSAFFPRFSASQALSMRCEIIEQLGRYGCRTNCLYRRHVSILSLCPSFFLSLYRAALTPPSLFLYGRLRDAQTAFQATQDRENLGEDAAKGRANIQQLLFVALYVTFI